MVLLTDIQAHWFYDRGDSVEIPAGRQVFPLLNPDVVKVRGRPKKALGQKSVLPTGVTTAAGPGLAAMRGSSQRRGRARGKRRGRGFSSSIPTGPSHEASYGASSTRRYPSAFEIYPHEFPTSMAPARLRKRPSAVIDISDDDEINEDNTITVELLPEAQQLLDLSLAEIAAGRPPTTLSTTQLALARGASGDDGYVPGTETERAYMRSKATITEADIRNKTLDELADEWHAVNDAQLVELPGMISTMLCIPPLRLRQLDPEISATEELVAF